MKYETYSKMSSKQKEEYNYRFDKEEFKYAPFNLNEVILTLALFLLFSWTIVLIGINEELAEYRNNIFNIISTMFKFFMVWFYVITFNTILWTIRSCFHWYKKRNWLKERGIK